MGTGEGYCFEISVPATCKCTALKNGNEGVQKSRVRQMNFFDLEVESVEMLECKMNFSYSNPTQFTESVFPPTLGGYFLPLYLQTLRVMISACYTLSRCNLDEYAAAITFLLNQF